MSTLYVDNLQPNLGSGVLIPGHVVQVVHTWNESQNITVSSDSLTNTGISLSITPKSASNKIFIDFNIHFVISNNAAGFRLGIYRSINGGADQALFDNGQDYSFYNRADGASNVTLRSYAPIRYYDSPATTSQVTYKLYGDYHTAPFGINNGGKSFLSLMEIAQ